MAVTPQTNTTLEEIAESLRASDNIVIAGHVSPDGDCLGSQLALAAALRQFGKTVTTTLAREGDLDTSLDYLPGFEGLTFAGNFKGRVDTFVALDVPTRDRMGEHQWRLHEKARNTVTVDHHAVPDRMAQLSYTDPDSASTTMLVWRIAQILGVDLSDGVAVCAYTGLVTDTNCFRNTNTDESAFRLAGEMVAAGVDAGAVAARVYQNRKPESLRLDSVVVDHMQFAADGQFAISWLTVEDFERIGAQFVDADNTVDLLRSLRGVRVACMLREVEGDKGVWVKGSFRAKDDTDVSAVARRHSGGGHKAAAGFKMFCPLPKALDQLKAEFEELLS